MIAIKPAYGAGTTPFEPTDPLLLANLIALIDNAPDIILSVDRHYRLILFNDAVRQELRQERGLEAIPGLSVLSWGNDEEIRERKARLDRAFAGERFSLETSFLLGDAVHHFIQSYHPIVLDEIVESVAVYRHDITHQKEIARLLALANQRFELAAKAVNSVIFDWDLASGRIERSKDVVTQFGLMPDESQPTFDWWMSRVHPEDREELHGRIGEALRSEQAFEAEYRMIHTSGRIMHIWDRGMIVRDAFGKAVRVVGSSQDITERKQMELQLRTAKAKAEEMNRLKSSFLANMSHEIRTPLTAILGFSEYLTESLEDPDLRRAAETIGRSGTRLLTTINGILDLAKIEANRIALDPVPVDPFGEVGKCVEMLRPLAEAKSLHLHAVPPEQDYLIHVDPQYLQQILVNLVGNAIKFTNEGSVLVSVGHQETEGTRAVQIHVTDTGIGIPQDQIDGIFNEFEQVSSGIARTHEGCGLGLTIARQLATLMGGTIHARSREGHGSTFTLSFPAISGL